MKILDTATLSLLFAGHPGVAARHAAESDEVATTIISPIEVLQGRFAMMLKAADGAELTRAQQWLDRTVQDLTSVPLRTK